MVRPKKGTPEGERAARKQHETLLRIYGSEEAVHRHYQEMGRKGGMKSRTGGFYANPQLAREVGRIAGTKSLRGYKLIEEEEHVRWYRNRKTGAVVKYIYDFDKEKYVKDEEYLKEIENETWI